MNYYLLETDGNNYQNLGFADGFPLDSQGKPDLLQWGMLTGKPIDSKKAHPVEVVYRTKTKKKPDLYFFDGLKIIVNERTKIIFEKYITLDICQFVPFLLINNKDRVENVFLLNPLITCDCVIREKSEYRTRGIFKFITKPVLDRKKILTIPIFLIIENPILTIINEELYNILIDNNINGQKITKIEVLD
jgi:hypothetical protein